MVASTAPSSSSNQRCTRRGLGVPAVELGIGALLLDDEDVDPQPAQAVDLERRQLGERRPAQAGRAHAASCSRRPSERRRRDCGARERIMVRCALPIRRLVDAGGPPRDQAPPGARRTAHLGRRRRRARRLRQLGGIRRRDADRLQRPAREPGPHDARGLHRGDRHRAGVPRRQRLRAGQPDRPGGRGLAGRRLPHREQPVDRRRRRGRPARAARRRDPRSRWASSTGPRRAPGSASPPGRPC